MRYLLRAMTLAISLLSSAMASANPVADVSAPAAVDNSPEPSKGAGLLVGGIVTTAVTPVIGAVIYLIGSLEAACDSQDKSASCGHNKAGPAAIGVAGVGVAAGVTMIVFSAKKRHAWKLWKAGHSESLEDTSKGNSDTNAVSFALVPQVRGVGGVLRYNF